MYYVQDTKNEVINENKISKKGKTVGMPQKKAEQITKTSSDPKMGISTIESNSVASLTSEKSEQLRNKFGTRNQRQMNARKSNLDKDYAELFKRLGLSGKEISILKDLIVEFEFAGKNAWLDPRFSMTQPPTPEEARNVADEYKQTINNDIKNLLGEDKYQEFNHYIETLDGRQLSNPIVARFDYEAEPITNEARESLIDILHESNDAFKTSGLSRVDDIAWTTFMKSETLKKAQQILTPSQLKSVENYYDEQIKTLNDLKNAGVPTL